MNWISIRGSYTGASDFIRGDDASGDSFSKTFEVNHRIALGHVMNWPSIECGEWFLRVGATYDRWDFDNAGGLPIPNTLQSFSATIALEYSIRDVVALSIEARPGFYFEHDVRGDSFNVPVIAYAPLWWHEGGDNLSWALIGGVSYNGFRSYLPVLPVIGLSAHWGKWSALLVPPAPRISYAASESLTLWLEGELAGGSFRTDDHTVPRKEKLNHAVLSYSEWRVGAGVAWKPCANALIDIGAGYAFNRKFDYHRAEEGFETDGGAPFVKVELRTTF